MRRSVLTAIAVSFLLVVPAFASNIGPVKTSVSAGDTFFGLGYSHTDSKWEEDGGSFSGLEMQQDKFFGQAGYGLSDNWSGYLRAGISTLNMDHAFLQEGGGEFEGENVFPFVTVGVNGLLFENDIFSIGPFVQGSYYFAENEDSFTYTELVDLIPQTFEETVTLDQMWEAKAGLEFQVELEGAQLYGGPMYYVSRADIESSRPGLVISKTMEEEDNFGFVFGIQWPLLEDVTLDLETQLRSDFDLGLVLNKRF